MKILIIDHDSDDRAKASICLKEAFPLAMVDQVSSGYDAVLRPFYDVYLIAGKMPGINGVELANRLLKLHPASRIVIYSGFWLESLVALQANKNGFRYVSKDSLSPGCLKQVFEVQNKIRA